MVSVRLGACTWGVLPSACHPTCSVKDARVLLHWVEVQKDTTPGRVSYPRPGLAESGVQVCEDSSPTSFLASASAGPHPKDSFHSL